jgi:hypothetical protein
MLNSSYNLGLGSSSPGTQTLHSMSSSRRVTPSTHHRPLRSPHQISSPISATSNTRNYGLSPLFGVSNPTPYREFRGIDQQMDRSNSV